MLPLDAVAATNRWRRRHPGEKALLSLGLLACALVLPPWPGAVVVAAVAVTALLGPAALPPRQAARALRAPLGFVLVGSVPLLVALDSETGLRWAPEGVALAAELALRATAALLCLLLFAATTPLGDVLPRLARLGVPAPVTEVAALVYRMLFLLLDSVRAVREAQASRLGFRTWRATYRSLAGQGAAVFVRAFDRARRWEAGLALRGYTGSLQFDVAPRPVSWRFVAGAVTVHAGVVTCTLVLA